MRYLLLTRGMPLCGKSEWIKKYDLTDYTLSLKVFKRLLRSPILDESGALITNYNENDKSAFLILFSALESRMSKGDFIIIEDNHISKSYFSNYKEIARYYNYKILVIDFSDVSLETIKERNKALESSLQYNNNELDSMYEEMKNGEIPIKCDIIKPEQIDKILSLEPKNLNGYKIIHHIGDIQGSFSVLKKYLNNIKDDEFYIFLGDYIDRGFQNYEVLKFLLSIMDKKNICLLEGNHEKWLIDWANNRDIESREFRLNTQIELEKKGFSKQDAKRFYNKLLPFFFYKFHDKRVICTHGGLSNMPKKPILLSSSQCIHGVGGYLNTSNVALSFTKNTPDNFYQFFGHRNKTDLPICIHERNFVMESKVEFGGYLRAVQLSQGGFKDCSIKNMIFVSKEDKDSKYAFQKYFDSIDKHYKKVKITYIRNFAIMDYPSKLPKDIENSQFAFSPSIIDVKAWKIVGRGYSFTQDFNIMFSNNLEECLESINYPIKIFSKYRGVNAILSFYNGSFFYFIDNVLQDNLPNFLCSKEIKKNMLNIFKNQNYSILLILDSNDSIILNDIICNECAISLESKQELIKKVAKICNIKHTECILDLDSKEKFKEFLSQLRIYNHHLSKKLKEADMQNHTIDSNKYASILESNKFYPLIAFDYRNNFINLPMCYDSEFNTIEQLVKIWKLQKNISKLQWINNPLREQFYEWFQNYIKKNHWRNMPISWIQNDFLTTIKNEDNQN